MSPEEQTLQAQPESQREQAQTVQSETVQTQPITSSDILKRASESNKKPSENTQNVEIPEKLYNEADLSSIKDPIARQVAKDIIDKKEKDMLKGMNDKFQKIADLRKELESKKQSLEGMTPQQRLDEIKNDKTFMEFVQAEAQRQQAHSAPSNWEGTQEEWSALSERDQQRFRTLEGQVNTLLTNQERIEVRQADERISQKLTGYDPKKVDTFQKDLASGRFEIGEIRELIGKAMLFESSVENAYELGLKDRNSGLTDKINATQSVGSVDAVSSREIPERKEGQKPKNYFLEIAKNNLDRLRTKGS